MKRLITSLILIPLALLAVFRAPDPIFTAVCAAVAILAMVEYLNVVEHFGFAVNRGASFLLAALLFAMLIGWPLLGRYAGPVVLLLFFLLVFVFAPAVYLFSQMRQSDLRQVMPGAALSFFSLPYIAGSFLCLALVRMLDHGWFFVLLCFAAVWLGDSAAFYIGSRWGKTKFSPVISPHKSWEGAIASIVGAVIIVVIFNAFSVQIEQGLGWAHLLNPVPSYTTLAPAPWWLAALAGAVLNIAGQFGDLFESMIKRGAGVKDSGNTLPGHGGILDRVDALLLASPVALVFFGLAGGKFLRMITNY